MDENQENSQNDVRFGLFRILHVSTRRFLLLLAVAIAGFIWLKYDFPMDNFDKISRRILTVFHGSNESSESLHPAVTVVTAYFDIGDFNKGGHTRKRTEYLEWMKIWAKVKNGVIFYTNNVSYQDQFKELRRDHEFPTVTVVVELNQTNDSFHSDYLWSSTLLPNITRIFQRPGYPQHHPNTVLPMYSVIMSAKYDMVEKAILTNPFKTAYFAWLDIGVYREYPRDGPCFTVDIPPDFNQSKIAMSEVSDFKFSPNRTASIIIQTNDVWVCGAAAFGESSTFLRYIEQFRSVEMKLIEIGWMSTDQQTVYAMFSDLSLNVSLNVDIQRYVIPNQGTPEYSQNSWFYLAYLARKGDTCAIANISTG